MSLFRSHNRFYLKIDEKAVANQALRFSAEEKSTLFLLQAKVSFFNLLAPQE